MGHVMSQAVIDDCSIEEVEFSSIFLTEDEVSNANDIKLVDGRWVYEVNRIIPLTSEEWDNLALEILMKENIDEQEPTPVEPEVQAAQEEISVEVEAEQTVVLEEPEVVQEAETPSEVRQSASAKPTPEYSLSHAFKDLFFPAY